MEKQIYVTPAVEAVTFASEGVVCASTLTFIALTSGTEPAGQQFDDYGVESFNWGD